ncbi:MAG: SPOR domain-containing protein [Pseudomonadota bacterium]
MRERSRYRITGSIFLVALAVIFLPMLFDGAGVPVREAPTAPQQPPLQVNVPRFDEVVPATDVVDRVATLRDEVTEDGFARRDGTRFGEPKLFPTDRDTTVWAVQAASFAQVANARKLRDDLRAAGFEAFISTLKTSSDSVLHRVAVGPLLDKNEADNLRQLIAERFSVQPDVVEMQP